MHCTYIMQDLLEGASTASALVLIGQLHKVKVIHIGAESVCQNCVIGRCAHLHVLHLHFLVLNPLYPKLNYFV